MMRTLTTGILTLSFLLAGCGGGGPEAANSAANVAGAPEASTPPAPAATPTSTARASVTDVQNDDYQFKYSYPAAAAAIAPLAKWLDDDRAEVLADLKKESAQDRSEAKKGGYDYRPHSVETEWKVVTDTPRLLSLSSGSYLYTGGAHGMPVSDALVWDKVKGERLEPEDLFTSEAAIQSAIGEEFCRLLDVERGKRRGSPVVRSNDSFNGCPKVDEATLILGSTDGRAVNRIGLLVDPYIAGPYAEGSFDLTLPVTAKLAAAVKPAFKDAFAVR